MSLNIQVSLSEQTSSKKDYVFPSHWTQPSPNDCFEPPTVDKSELCHLQAEAVKDSIWLAMYLFLCHIKFQRSHSISLDPKPASPEAE